MPKEKIHAKKSLGQNFLSNPKILESIIDAANVQAGDQILEIGPGTGNLTDALLNAGAKVLAVEKDHRLIESLEKRAAANEHFQIIEGDVMTFEPAAHDLQPDQYKVVANIPYYLTSHLLRIMLEEWPRPEKIVLMVQREVAQRLIATPPDMNLLALSVQCYADVRIVRTVKRGNFQPVPEVDSAIIELIPKASADRELNRSLLSLAKTTFNQKRKRLASVLSPKLRVPSAEIERLLEQSDLTANARPQELALAVWQTLTHFALESRM